MKHSMNAAVPLLHDYLEHSASAFPQKVALVCQSQRLTYAEIDASANAMARTLQSRGVCRGDRVMLLLENSVEAVIAFWATLKAGGVAVAVNPQTRPEKFSYMLSDCRAAALVADARVAASFMPAIAGAPEVLVVLAGQLAGPLRPARCLPFEDAVRGGDAGAPERRAIDVDLAAIIYTSGSTGEPKGVMLTHRNMLAAATSITTYLESRHDDVVLAVLPLSFDYGLYQMIMTFKLGATLLLERSFAYPADVLQRVVTEGVTAFPGVPTIFAMMADMRSLPEYDFSRVRYVTNTAAALPVKHIGMLSKLFPHARIYSMYGLTECKRCTYLPPKDLNRKPTSVGIAIPNTEVWVVDEEDRRLGPGEVGQLVVRGATVMRGYWDKPEETARKLRPGPLAGELVLYTGDYCTLDEEGYVYFVGRMDDIIKSRGEKVAPKEVEAAIVDLDGVREVAVVGVADALLGQAIKAFVVLESGSTLTARDVERHCRLRLDPFMVPRFIELRGELPRTATGKILKLGLA